MDRSVPGASWAELDPARRAACLDHDLGEVDDSCLDSSSEIECLTAGFRALGGGEEPANEIINIDEVTGLVAGSRDHQGLAVERAPDEVRDHIAVGSRDLARTIGVEEAAANGRYPGIEVVAVELAERLRDLVRRVERKADRHILANRRVDAVARDRAACRGVNQASSP